MIKQIITPFLIIGLLYGCNRHKSNCTITSNDLVSIYGNSVFGTEYKNDMMLEYRDLGKDSIRGGYYTFHENGHLATYHFFADMVNYVYSESYNKSGKLVNVEGNPFVFNRVTRLKADSVRIDMYFFSMNKTYESLSIETMNNKSFLLKLRQDTFFSNMKTASFGFSFIGEPNITVFLEMAYKDLCVGKVGVVKDTIIANYVQ